MVSEWTVLEQSVVGGQGPGLVRGLAAGGGGLQQRERGHNTPSRSARCSVLSAQAQVAPMADEAHAAGAVCFAPERPCLFRRAVCEPRPVHRTPARRHRLSALGGGPA